MVVDSPGFAPFMALVAAPTAKTPSV